MSMGYGGFAKKYQKTTYLFLTNMAVLTSIYQNI